MKRWLAAVLLGVGLLAAPRLASAQVLWSFDESSSATDGSGHKLYGWDGRWGNFGTEFSDAQVVGGNTYGGDSVRFTYLSWAGQIYAGGDTAVTDPAFGSSIFVRGRLKYHMGDVNDIHTQKLVIVGNNLPSNRPILTIGTHFGPPDILRFGLQIDGGGGAVQSGGYPMDTWLSWQFEIYPGTSSGATDGYYKLWTATSGTMTYASPHGTTVNTFTNTDRQELGNVYMGFYMNDPMSVSDTWTIDYADFEIASSFVSSWASGGQAAPTVSSASPSTGTTIGGTTITITGADFVATPTVTVGGVTCTSPHFTSSTQIECTTGSHAAGTVDIVVTNPDAQAGTGTNDFTYETVSTGPYRIRFKLAGGLDSGIQWAGIVAAFGVVVTARRRRKG